MFYCECRFVTLAAVFITNILPTHRHDVTILCVSRGLHGCTKCIRLHRFCGRDWCIIIIIILYYYYRLGCRKQPYTHSWCRIHVLGIIDLYIGVNNMTEYEQ